MIIVDTNVILSAILTKGITKVVLTANKDVYMTPQSCFDELWKHRDVWNKNNQPDEDLKYILSRFTAIWCIHSCRSLLAFKRVFQQRTESCNSSSGSSNFSSVYCMVHFSRKRSTFKCLLCLFHSLPCSIAI